jgi:hypothetical protein
VRLLNFLHIEKDAAFRQSTEKNAGREMIGGAVCIFKLKFRPDTIIISNSTEIVTAAGLFFRNYACSGLLFRPHDRDKK